MSDFLINFNKTSTGSDVSMMQRVYGENKPEGKSFECNWYNASILKERLANDENIIETDKGVFGWVGSLTEPFDKRVATGLVEFFSKPCDESSDIERAKPLLDKLNGAFAIFIAFEDRIVLITDPLSFTQIYYYKDEDDNLLAVGTHPDITAVVADDNPKLDMVSLSHFLSIKHPVFPYTFFENLKELKTGTVFVIERDNCKFKDIISYRYWYPPYKEEQDLEQASEKFVKLFNQAVSRNCSQSKKTAVALSGGFDSRLVLASAKDKNYCEGVNITEVYNREADTAARVCKALGVKFNHIERPKEFLADAMEDTIRFGSGQWEFVHAHFVGLTKYFKENGFDNLITGDMFDSHFRECVVADYEWKNRWKGLLPRKYTKNESMRPFKVSDFVKENYNKQTMQNFSKRRQATFDAYSKSGRESLCAWLCSYPFTHWLEAQIWSAQRRSIPVRLVGTDRDLLEFAFSCPVEHKLYSMLYKNVAKRILGRAARIPLANDGVRPGSGHCSRLAQRAMRKALEGFYSFAKKFGYRRKVHHSWQDYQWYWDNSEAIKKLIDKYADNLNIFEGVLFDIKPSKFLTEQERFWEDGFRLLQIAIWLGIIEEYKSFR